MASAVEKHAKGHAPYSEWLLKDYLLQGAEPHGICPSPIPESIYFLPRRPFDANIQSMIEREVRRQLKEYEPLLKRLKDEGEAFEKNVRFMNKLMHTKVKKDGKKKVRKMKVKLFENYDDFEDYLKSCE